MALLILRALYVWRKPFTAFFQVFLPVVFLITVMSLSKNSKAVKTDSSRIYQLSDFGRSSVVCGASAGVNAQALLASYRQLLKSTPHELVEKPSVYDHLIRVAKTDTFEFIYRHFVAAQFETKPDGSVWATVLYNQQALESATISLNLVDNAILRHVIGPRYSIEVSSLPSSVKVDKKFFGKYNNLPDFSLMFSREAIILIFGILAVMLPITMASYVTLIVTERVGGMKHLQLMTGVSPVTLWAAMLTFDSFAHFLTVALMLVALNVYDVKLFAGVTNSFYIGVLLITYGFATLPMTYLMSFLFQSPTSGLIFVAMFNLTTGE